METINRYTHTHTHTHSHITQVQLVKDPIKKLEIVCPIFVLFFFHKIKTFKKYIGNPHRYGYIYVCILVFLGLFKKEMTVFKISVFFMIESE